MDALLNTLKSNVVLRINMIGLLTNQPTQVVCTQLIRMIKLMGCDILLFSCITSIVAAFKFKIRGYQYR